MGDNDQLVPSSDDLPEGRVRRPRSLHLWCHGAVPRSPTVRVDIDPDPDRVRGAYLQWMNCETVRCLRDFSGRNIEWWADRDGAERIAATFYGSAGLATSSPYMNSWRESVDWVRCVVLGDPIGEVAELEHRPAAEECPVHAAELDVLADEVGLGPSARGLLRNLPDTAHRELLAPLATSGERVRRCDWHYEGTRDELSMFLVYLLGARYLVVAHGRRTIPAGHTAASAWWSLRVACRPVLRRRVGVVRRDGGG